ncbi:MAG: Ig-like domain-containing protein [Oscillospiraceae bacterium]|nr:Ig-like domain-containing protein [Oscillospiraceae bacterium]
MVRRTAGVAGAGRRKQDLPATVSVTTESGKTVSVPVAWSNSGYNPYASSQTISGTLSASGVTGEGEKAPGGA